MSDVGLRLRERERERRGDSTDDGNPLGRGVFVRLSFVRGLSVFRSVARARVK